MITVYASTSTIDVGSPTSVDLEKNFVDLPVTVINLYAHAVDSTDANATFTYSWHILKKPDLSSASLSSQTIQNPLLNTVDNVGNIRLFCIATNTSTFETSQIDPIQASNEAFCVVRVKTEHLSLQKPAGGERDWMNHAYAWVDALEAHESRLDTTENLEFSDGTTSSTLNLNNQTLTFSGTSQEVTASVSGQTVTLGLPDSVTVTSTLLASGLKSNTGLTLNNDDTADALTEIIVGRVGNKAKIAFDDATDDTWKLDRGDGTYKEILTTEDNPTNTKGGAALLEGATGNSSGKILNRETFIFTQNAYSSVTHTTSGKEDDSGIVDTSGITGNNAGDWIILFHNPTQKQLKLDSISIAIAYSGDTASSSQNYEFTPVIYTNLTKVLDKSVQTTLTALSLGFGSSSGDHIPKGVEQSYANANHLIDAGEYFGLICTNAPTTKGYNLYATFMCSREIGV